MDISNLKVGQVFKNYKELCEALGVDPKASGKSRKLQEEEIKRFIDYKIVNRKYKVLKILEKEQEKMDKRKLGNNNTQAASIRYLLLNLLSKTPLKEGEIYGISKGLLLRKLNMVNDNYSIARDNREGYADALEVNRLAVDECIEFIDDRSIKAVKKAIQVLINQSVLGFKQSYTWVDKLGHWHNVDVEEHKMLLEAEYEAMKILGIKHKHLIYKFGKWDDFKDLVKKYILENYSSKTSFYKFDFYYSSYHFIYNNHHIVQHMTWMQEKQDLNLEVAKQNIQDLWSKSLDKTINTTYDKQDKVVFGSWEHFTEIENFRDSDKYIPQMTKVKESLTKDDYEKVKITSENTQDQLKIDLENIDIPF